MGIYTSARIIVGLSYSEITEISQEELESLIENEEIEITYPYYGADREYGICGITLVDNYGDPLEFSISNMEIITAENRFIELCKCTPKLYLSQHIH